MGNFTVRIYPLVKHAEMVQPPFLTSDIFIGFSNAEWLRLTRRFKPFLVTQSGSSLKNSKIPRQRADIVEFARPLRKVLCVIAHFLVVMQKFGKRVHRITRLCVVRNELHNLIHFSVASECLDQLFSEAQSIDLQPSADRVRAVEDPPEWVHLRER